MLSFQRSWVFFAIVHSLVGIATVTAEEGIKGNLVTVSWLGKNLKNPKIVIVDASPSQTYTAKHIPGAHSHDIFNYGPFEPPVSEIEKRYQSWGISPGKKIVIYDQGGTYLATRLFFSLYYHGFPAKDLYILDGGLFKWQEAGLPVSTDPPASPEKGSFTIKKLNAEARADLPEFLTASADLSNNSLLEALDAGWHYGGSKFFGKPGHIPHAIMLPSVDFFNSDKTFKSAEEIHKMMQYVGIKREQQVYTHCGGGIAASVPFFTLRFILGYPKVKLFPGSQLEWVTDPRDLPFWTYDAPYLMREAQWLQSWGGQMARMYGISKVSIVDVRPTSEYRRARVPFALNIPDDVFRNNVANPDQLARALGAAGVSMSDEAVVVSGAGLTKEAALAFMMLEKLGQSKTSILIDSMDEWVKLGFPVTNDSAEASAKGPRMSGSPKTYQVNLREGVVIADQKGSQGLYAKVFVASGSSIPANAPDGKVLHVPFASLLNSDGRPRAANEIWNVLTKAGVPRYAEIVCFSEDPAEAALNYFMLKLMGYPDVKVLTM
jgi:3-mercaptopyruvate sulfurtransferase SseA